MFLNNAFNELGIDLAQDVLPGGISKLVCAVNKHHPSRQPGKFGNLKCPLPNFVRPDYQEPGCRNLFNDARVVPCPVAKMKIQAGQAHFFEEPLFGSVLEGFKVFVYCKQAGKPEERPLSSDPDVRLERWIIRATACAPAVDGACPAGSNNPDYVRRVIEVQI